MYEMDEVSCSDGLRLFPLPSDRDFLLMCRRLPLSLTLNALDTFLVPSTRGIEVSCVPTSPSSPSSILGCLRVKTPDDMHHLP